MSTWFDFPQAEGDSVSFNGQTGFSLFNIDNFDEIALNMKHGKPCEITGTHGDKSTVLFRGRPEDVTAAWLTVTRTLRSKTVSICRQKSDQPVQFTFHEAPEEDAETIVNTFLIRTGSVKTDEELLPYERLFLTSLVKYICVMAPICEQDFATVSELLNAFEIRKDDEDFKNAVDMLFDEEDQNIEAEGAVRDYIKFKQLPQETQRRVRNSCCERLKSMGYSMNFPDENDSKEYGNDWDIWDDFDKWDKEEN